MKIKRSLTVSNILNQKIERIPFEGEWYEAFKQPQSRGFWFIYGGSGSGKSTFAMQLSKELAKTYNTLYNLLEEEPDDSDFVERVELCKMQDVKNKFHVQNLNLEELNFLLERRNSPQVVIIDSAPYFFVNFSEYRAFKQKWATKKLVILTGHAIGKNPATEMERRIKYDAKMKVFISGYLATNQGRTIGPNGGRYIVWDEGYNALYGVNKLDKIEM